MALRKMLFPDACHLLMLAALAPQVATAQDYPIKPIRIVVPNPPGGVDLSIRLLAPKMQEDLGQTVFIENRAGANGNIGAEHIARSAPDGYSLLYTTASTLVTGPLLVKATPFDPTRDFTPIGTVMATVSVLTVHPSLPVQTVKDLIDHARKFPGKLTYAHSGAGSLQHLDGEMMKIAFGNTDILAVPFKGFAQIMPELLTGRVDIGVAPLFLIKPQAASGKLRILAVYSQAKRYPGLPNTPTVAETVPAFDRLPSWFALVGPAGMARPVVMRIHGAVQKALSHPEIRAKFDDEGSVALPSTPEELGAMLRNDRDRTAQVFKALKIEAE
ncbi:MAG: Bug family tripartite tricarboxylate transporter substrate binding protein [Burkholderiales bacterium]